MMDVEGMLLCVQEYIESPKFLSMTGKQKANFVKHGIPMLIGALAGVEVLSSVIKSCELDRLNREIETARLAKIWELGSEKA